MSEALTPSYPSRLDFQGISLRVIDHEGRPWLTAADLARALGYSRADYVSRIYERHKDEFTEEMTTTVKMTVVREGRGEVDMDVRIFSPRGCYLIAMFARTPVAKAFRKWVLDVLEKLEREGRVELRKRPALPETVEERLQLAERIVQGLRRLDLLDDQARLLYQEVAMNALAQLTGKTEPVDLGELWTLEELRSALAVKDRVWFRVRGRIGKAVKKRWLETSGGKPPKKVRKFVGGSFREVCAYPKSFFKEALRVAQKAIPSLVVGQPAGEEVGHEE